MEMVALALHAVSVALLGEAERVAEQRFGAVGNVRRGIRARAGDAHERVLAWDLAVLGGGNELARPDDDQFEREAVVVAKAQPLGPPLRRVTAVRQPSLPKAERILRGDSELNEMDHARARATAGGIGKLEPGHQRSGRAALVAEVEVVGVGLIEVDRLL